MPTLDWIGRRAVINQHREVPYRLLRCEESLSVGDPDAGNLLVQGDNLLALKALLPYYAGKVKCIYIDPPYNTGNEGWVYNDNTNSPEIRSWLGKVVGKEAEDLSRHDKWLCMMYPRLALLKDFLTEDGVIFVSIDDNEAHFLRMLMDEIFGFKRRLASFVWRTDGNFDNQAKIKNCHEYVLAYSMSPELFDHPNVIDPSVSTESKLYKPVIRNTIVKNGAKNPVSEVTLPTGFPADFESGFVRARSDAYPIYEHDVFVENYCLTAPVIAKTGWSSRTLLTKFIDAGFQPIPDTKGQPTRFLMTRTGAIESLKDREQPSHVISVISGVGTTQSQSAYLAAMGFTFPFPKPVELIKYLISMTNDESCIVLDSFAGSGTTAHAVLALNREDGGSRRFITVELVESICRDITAQRLRHEVFGHGDIEPLGSGFRFCNLGDPLFDELGNIRPEVTFGELAAHVFFTETGSPIPAAFRASTPSPFLGVHEGKAVYLLFNGVLGDKRPNGGNVLTSDVLKFLPPYSGTKVIYGEGCRLSDARLRRESVVFKQVPYQIKVD